MYRERTQFIETEALLLALEATDGSPELHSWRLSNYLQSQFMNNELRALSDACDRLSGAIADELRDRREKGLA